VQISKKACGLLPQNLMAFLKLARGLCKKEIAAYECYQGVLCEIYPKMSKNKLLERAC
jgi:hypothetical protein